MGEAIAEANFIDHKPNLIGILFWQTVAFRDILEQSLKEQVTTKIETIFYSIQN